MPQNVRPFRPIALSALVAGTLLALAGPAYADSQPQSGAAAIQQYVEALPTGSGASVPGLNQSQRAQLPPAAVASLRYAPASIATTLAKVATSPAYGAPTSPNVPSTEEQPPSSAGSAVWRSLGAAGTADDARLLGLVSVLVVLTVGAGALAARGSRL